MRHWKKTRYALIGPPLVTKEEKSDATAPSGSAAKA